MTTQFFSIAHAQSTAAALSGHQQPKKVTFEEIPGLQVMGMESILLDDPETPKSWKQTINNRLEAQKGFKFKGPDGKEIKIVIGPFRDGFECWVVGDNGSALRL